MLSNMLKNVRENHPLIHNITNYVTVNDCANVLLACGASPIMADDREEAAEITTICAGLNIDIGTLNSRTIESMYLAGKQVNALGHPVVLGPIVTDIAPEQQDSCSMCGKFCAVRSMNKALNGEYIDIL